MHRRHWSLAPSLFTVLAALLLLSACGADDSTPSPSGGLAVTVSLNGEDVSVTLSAAPSVEFMGDPAVRLSDLFAAAFPGVDYSELFFDFVGSDGFRPLDGVDCDNLIPLPGTRLGDGYVMTADRYLLWDEAAEMPGCMRVKNLARIEASGTAQPSESEGDGETLPPADLDEETSETEPEITEAEDELEQELPDYGSVLFVVDGQETVVALNAVTPVVYDGDDAVTLADLFAVAAPGADPAQHRFYFESSDGYRPEEKEYCTPIMPILGDQLALGYVFLVNHNLTWDAAAGYPGCLRVKDLARVEATHE